MTKKKDLDEALKEVDEHMRRYDYHVDKTHEHVRDVRKIIARLFWFGYLTLLIAASFMVGVSIRDGQAGSGTFTLVAICGFSVFRLARLYEEAR